MEGKVIRRQWHMSKKEMKINEIPPQIHDREATKVRAPAVGVAPPPIMKFQNLTPENAIFNYLRIN